MAMTPTNKLSKNRITPLFIDTWNLGMEVPWNICLMRASLMPGPEFAHLADGGGDRLETEDGTVMDVTKLA
jgi:hypothetical protein